MKGTFTETIPGTIGSATFLGEFRHGRSGCIFELWDTGGTERYRSLCAGFARDARGAILVFDVTDHQSFEDLVGWCQMVRNVSLRAHIIIFGNKTDKEAERAVTSDEANWFAAEIGVPLFEGSVKLASPAPGTPLLVEIGDPLQDDLLEMDSESTRATRRCPC
jgi:small GTP-binding protein